MQEEQSTPKRPSTFPMFSKHLSLQPMTVVEYANDCRKQFQDFTEAFRKRIQIEHEYAKNLQNCSKLLDKYLEAGSEKSVSFICSAFKVENQQRSNQAKQLAQSLKTEIHEICSHFSKEETALVKKVEKNIKKYIKQYHSLEDALEGAQENYQKVSKDTEQLLIVKNFLKYTSEIPQDKKVKLISKTMDSIKEKKQYEKIYVSANRQFNEFVKEYNRCIEEDLNQLQERIREQLTLEVDCLRKLIVCEVSMFKNIEYDLINISKQMEGLDIQKDMDILVKRNRIRENNTNMICSDSAIQEVVPSAQGPNAQIKSTIFVTLFSLIILDKRKSTNLSDDNKSENVSNISNDDDVESINDGENVGGIRSTTYSVVGGNRLLLKLKESTVDNDMLSISLRNVEEELFSYRLMNRKDKRFKAMIDGRWTELNSQKKEDESTGKQIKPKQRKESLVETADRNGETQRDDKVEDQDNGNKAKKERLEEKERQEGPQESAKELTVEGQQSRVNQKGEDSKQKLPETEQQGVQKGEPVAKNQSPNSSAPQPGTPTPKQLFLEYFNNSTFSKGLLSTASNTDADGSGRPATASIEEIYQNFLMITRYINEVWNGTPLTLIKSATKSAMVSPLSEIKKLLQKDHFYRICAYTFLENYRTHHQVMIGSGQRAKEIGKFINSLIIKSSKENDVFVLRGLLGLLFTYFWIDVESKNKKLLYVERSVYKNSIWRRHDFWDGAIFQSTYEEMIGYGSQQQKGESHTETILREKNLIFSQLASYCHYMIMLGIVSKHVRQIVGRYCRFYEMTDEQNKDLSKMITNTVKQYKEILSVYKKKSVEDEVKNN